MQYKKIWLTLFLVFFSISSAHALDEETEKKLKAGGKKVKALIEKYNKLKLDKYNETTVTVKDTDGNPRDCGFRLYYNDYKQEKFSTSGGSFSGLFNHEKTFPTKLLSVAVEDCPCKVIKMDQTTHLPRN